MRHLPAAGASGLWAQRRGQIDSAQAGARRRRAGRRRHFATGGLADWQRRTGRRQGRCKPHRYGPVGGRRTTSPACGKRDGNATATGLGEIHARLDAIDAYAAPSRAASISGGLGFSAPEQLRPCGEFSGRLAHARGTRKHSFCAPDLLLLDEPTNYLDLEGVLWLEITSPLSRDGDHRQPRPRSARRARGVLLAPRARAASRSIAATTKHCRNREARARWTRRSREAGSGPRQMQELSTRFRYKQSKARQAQKTGSNDREAEADRYPARHRARRADPPADAVASSPPAAVARQDCRRL